MITEEERSLPVMMLLLHVDTVLLGAYLCMTLL
jgi:hypothetical protein